MPRGVIVRNGGSAGRIVLYAVMGIVSIVILYLILPVGARVERLDTRVNENEKSLVRNEQRWEGLSGTLEKFDESVKQLSADVKELSKEINKMNRRNSRSGSSHDGG